MRPGKMYKPGDVILAFVQFADSNEIKVRPATVLFEEHGNIVIAGITSNLKMQGIPLTQKEGAVKDSVIKTNYIFTVSEALIKKKLFTLTKTKRKTVFQNLAKKLQKLNE
jgi:mRNA interferase MazF